MIKTSDLKKLRERLKKLSDVAPSGSHIKVADKMGVSSDYLYQIRTGKNMTVDNEKNRKFIAKANSIYKQIIDREMAKMKSL